MDMTLDNQAVILGEYTKLIKTKSENYAITINLLKATLNNVTAGANRNVALLTTDIATENNK